MMCDDTRRHPAGLVMHKGHLRCYGCVLELLSELAELADSLKDPTANAYDGATTRGVIVQRLQEWNAK